LFRHFKIVAQYSVVAEIAGAFLGHPSCVDLMLVTHVGVLLRPLFEGFVAPKYWAHERLLAGMDAQMVFKCRG
jgi:hypothetical protein